MELRIKSNFIDEKSFSWFTGKCVEEPGRLSDNPTNNSGVKQVPRLFFTIVIFFKYHSNRTGNHHEHHKVAGSRV